MVGPLRGRQPQSGGANLLFAENCMTVEENTWNEMYVLNAILPSVGSLSMSKTENLCHYLRTNQQEANIKFNSTQYSRDWRIWLRNEKKILGG